MINILGTLRFNIKAFGLVKGLRLPVVVYGNIKIRSIGTIRINCPVRRGLICIGTNHDTVVAPYTMFCNTGTVEVNGQVYLNYGMVFINKGLVKFGGSDLIGNQCFFDIHDRLEIGHNVSLGYESHVSDCDHHYVVDVNTRRVSRDSVPVVIGNFNWFGSNCFVKKGTITPDHLIVASPYSMLSKDYSSLPPYTVLAGCPAKPVKQGIQRVYNFKEERKIREFFLNHPEAEFYQMDGQGSLDDICRL